jgi:hypothetical protein
MLRLAPFLRRHHLPLRWGLLLAGAAVGLTMVARCQVGGDQLNLLARGWLLAERGQWVQFGMPTSAGGLAPGGLTSLMVGVPLMVWRDFRAPTLLLWLTHLAAFLLLDRTVGRALGPRGRLLLVVLYWLSPWQLYFSGHLWNPNYMFLFAALHLATAWASRERASFWASLAHVAGVGLAVQLHASAPVLALASLLLIGRRQVRVSWTGAVAGAALVALSLLPWAAATLEAPLTLPGGKGFLGRGLLYVFPLLRGLAFLLRYGSLLVSGRMLRLDFTPTLGAGADALLAPALTVLAWVVLPVTLLLPLIACARLWRARRRLLRRPPPGRPLPPRRWLEAYAVTGLAAAATSFALSPTTAMSWQGFVVFPAALLPGLLLADALLRSRRAELAARALAAWAAAALLLGLVIGVASPMYRRGGREPVTIAVAADHPMLHDLGISERCSTPVVGADGYTPDVFRSGGGEGSATAGGPARP